jgi:hypothetical protein
MTENQSADVEMIKWWVPISAAFLPFLVWPVEMLLPYPAVIEELAKGYLVWLVVKQGPRAGGWQTALSIGLLFGGSETLLYTVNAILSGSLEALVARVLLTMPMHAATVMVMYWLGQRGKIWFGVGLVLAMVMHWGFNQWVG